MSRKKPKKPQPGISWREVLAIFASITGLISSVLAWLDIVQYGQMGYQNFLWTGIVVFVVIWGIVLWLLYKQKNIYLNIWLAVTIIVGLAAGIGWTSNQRAEEERIRAREEKVIVLIAKFDGPEEEYGLRDEMLEQLRETTKDYDDTELIAAEELITVAEGSDFARALGEKYQADLVIWAWYKPTEDPNITIHIENLSADIFILNESEIYQPQATLIDLEAFTIQRKLGSEASTLITFISGVIQFKSGDINSAISRIKTLLDKQQDLSTYIRPVDLNYTLGYMYKSKGDDDASFFYLSEAINADRDYSPAYNLRGLVWLDMGKNEEALADLTTATQLDPNSAAAFNNRGIVNDKLERLDDALNDYTQSILIDWGIPEPYNGRAMVFISMGKYESAIVDLESAIALRPQYADAYANFGVTYYRMKRYEQAMENFNKALQINPKHADTYYNRGNLYHFALNKISLAINDYTDAIKYGTKVKSVYIHRCNAYSKLGSYELALEDCNKAVAFMPDLPIVYDNRGFLLEKMGRFTEAQADFAKYKELTEQEVP